MQRLLFNLHLWTAMLAGVLLVILGVTGAVLAFEQPIDHFLNPGLFYVQPQKTELPITEVMASLRKAFPKVRANMLMLSQAPDLSTMAAMRGFSAFVDPHTGRVLGSRRGRGFTQTVHELHMRLLLGATGETINSVATVGLIFLTLSGIILWWPLKRVTIARGKSWRRLNFDMHHAIGFYSSVFLLVLSVTGVMIGFGDYTVPWMYRVTKSEPTDSTMDSTPVQGASPISPDEALRKAQPALPGTTPVSIVFPANRDTSYRVAFRYPEDRTPGGRSRVLVDQFSGAILLVESSRTAPAGTRLINLNRALHTGDIEGWPTKILVCLMSLAVVAQAFTGVVMWWKRWRSTKRPAPLHTDRSQYRKPVVRCETGFAIYRKRR